MNPLPLTISTNNGEMDYNKRNVGIANGKVTGWLGLIKVKVRRVLLLQSSAGWDGWMDGMDGIGMGITMWDDSMSSALLC